jgi:hypothetical protein
MITAVSFVDYRNAIAVVRQARVAVFAFVASPVDVSFSQSIARLARLPLTSRHVPRDANLNACLS